MKKLILMSTLALSLTAFASTSPNPPWLEAALNDPDNLPIQSKRGYFDFGTGAAVNTVTGYNTGINLPANAVIKQTHFEISTAFVDAGFGRVSLGCASTVDIFAAADITGSSTGDFLQGIADNEVGNFSKILTKCNVRAYIDLIPITEGELNIFIEYFLTK